MLGARTPAARFKRLTVGLSISSGVLYPSSGRLRWARSQQLAPQRPFSATLQAQYPRCAKTNSLLLLGQMRAVRLLTPKVEISCTVVGGGDDLPRLKTLAHELGLRSQVDFRGRVDQEDLMNCYSEGDLFILASKASPRDVEVFGIVFIEASAAGVLVIASLEGGASDAVQEGVSGLVIPDSSPSSLALGIERYLAERGRFETERMRGSAEQFRWESLAPQLLRELASAP